MSASRFFDSQRVCCQAPKDPTLSARSTKVLISVHHTCMVSTRVGRVQSMPSTGHSPPPLWRPSPPSHNGRKVTPTSLCMEAGGVRILAPAQMFCIVPSILRYWLAHLYPTECPTVQIHANSCSLTTF